MCSFTLRYLAVKSIAVLVLALSPGAILADDAKANGLVALFSSVPENTDRTNYLGTGFVVDDYWMITARHVIEKAVVAPGYSVNNPLLTIRPQSPMSQDSVGFVRGTLKCPTSDGKPVDVCFLQLVKNEAKRELDPFTEFSCDFDENDPIEVHGFQAGEQGVVKDVAGKIESTKASKVIQYVSGGDLLEHTTLARSTLKTAPGLSGSPIFRKGTNVILGVHNGRGGDLKYFTPLYYVDKVKLSPASTDVFSCYGNSGSSGDGTRKISYVMKYLAEADVAESEEEVRRLVFNGISYVRSLAGDSLSGAAARQYVEGVSVHATNDAVTGFEQLKNLWSDSQRNILQILHGELVPSGDPQAPYSVESVVYLGSLAADIGFKNAPDQFEISTSGRIGDYRKTADGHQLVTLYAMIMEAIRQNQPEHVTLGLFSLAFSIRDTLAGAGQLTGDLVVLSEVLERLKLENGL